MAMEVLLLLGVLLLLAVPENGGFKVLQLWVGAPSPVFLCSPLPDRWYHVYPRTGGVRSRFLPPEEESRSSLVWFLLVYVHFTTGHLSPFLSRSPCFVLRGDRRSHSPYLRPRSVWRVEDGPVKCSEHE